MHGNIKKVAACYIKPYELIERGEMKEKESDMKKQVMLEDGVEDVDNLLSDLETDVVGVKYLKMTNSISFSEMCTYVIELSVSEHWRPKV